MWMKNNGWKCKDVVSFCVRFYSCYHKYLQDRSKVTEVSEVQGKIWVYEQLIQLPNIGMSSLKGEVLVS